jgi:hypothetical protein
MTVAELIEALRALPQEARVMLSYDSEGQVVPMQTACIQTKTASVLAEWYRAELGFNEGDTIVILEMEG